MKALWILAAAASLAACHHQTEDEMGAAPQRDTTAVTRDTTAVRPADTTQVTQPAAPAPTPADTGMKADTSSMNPNGAVTPDTSGAAAPAPAPTPSPTDTSSMGKDTGAVSAPSVDTSSTKTGGDSSYSK
ncbi:MAG TPA: hypothetical protein VH763_02995 [Gemmatimonadales bacterium]